MTGKESPGKATAMKKATSRIGRKIILAFLFCLLSVLLFAILSFQVHREIGHRLRLLEVADDLVNNILEIRRFEKNFFLYKQRASLSEALSYVSRVEELYKRQEQETPRLALESKGPPFLKMLARYKETLVEMKSELSGARSGDARFRVSDTEESLRTIGQELLDMAGAWAKEERSKIEHLFRRAFYLFVISMVFFVVLGIIVALYISRLITRPLIQMQQAMEKIAQGDFTPIADEECRSEEFLPLFRAFNRMIRELEERQEQLVQARKISAIGTFTSGIAHELNNPVNNIVLTAEVLKEDFNELDRDEALGLVQDIIGQSERASEIIKNLLDFSRSERPEMISVAIRSVILDTVRLIRNQLLVSGVEATTEIPANLPAVCGDYKGLQQVFLNLFLNAIQAMPRGGRLDIRATASEDGTWVTILVSDTGTGIESEDISRIFDPFFTTKEVGIGTGLGLSVSYSILKKHGGTIEVKSKQGAGTTFTINLPAERKAEQVGDFNAASSS
jgi:two-component system NtrC family sensor kinase